MTNRLLQLKQMVTEVLHSEKLTVYETEIQKKTSQSVQNYAILDSEPNLLAIKQLLIP